MLAGSGIKQSWLIRLESTFSTAVLLGTRRRLYTTRARLENIEMSENTEDKRVLGWRRFCKDTSLQLGKS